MADALVNLKPGIVSERSTVCKDDSSGIYISEGVLTIKVVISTTTSQNIRLEYSGSCDLLYYAPWNIYVNGQPLYQTANSLLLIYWTLVSAIDPDYRYGE